MSIPDGQRRLRQWVKSNTGHGHPVRDEFARSSLSAVLRRLIVFGVEDALKRYAARDLLGFQTMCTGDFADLMARIACTRAIVEDDRPAIDAIADAEVASAQLTWFLALDRSESGEAPALLAGITDHHEELHVARLVAARRHPALLDPAWLWAVPEHLPLVAAELCRTALRARHDLAGPVAALLAARRPVLMAVDPDLLLAPLVAISGAHPQTVLRPFEGIYGDATVAAAAAWHVEHGEPREALELGVRIRPLSAVADEVRTVAVIAQLELGALREAREISAAITDPLVADSVALRIAERDPGALSDADLAALAQRCPATRPETFFAALRLLLARKLLPVARAICGERQGEFADHPTISQAMSAVLGAARG